MAEASFTDWGLASAVTDIINAVRNRRLIMSGDLAERLETAEDVLRIAGFERCNIAACNCNSWHQVGGFKARFDEIREVAEEAGYAANGRTALDAVKLMASDAVKYRYLCK